MNIATSVTIADLNVYPVKSCRGIPLDAGEVRATGFDGDRHWMIINDKGRYLSQRELPRMALIAPEITTSGLTLNAPGMPQLDITSGSQSAAIEVTVMMDRCRAFHCGDAAAQWLTQFLGRPVRLARFDATCTRAVHPSLWKGDIDSIVEFCDAFPFLIISEASLDDLNARLPSPLPMNRFRPSIVLRGLQPYDEDRIHALVVGDVTLRLVRSCTRCVITTTDQSAPAWKASRRIGRQVIAGVARVQGTRVIGPQTGWIG
ncbi:MAG TPA: MOSC N-terminal beta barrel domain-containing protein [Steroidobacter sp.]|uniref:MOSC domain-containing protein n=1 Tax=Steroidobacter sp. TaxID=1978227 RepID=UPI002ED880E0